MLSAYNYQHQHHQKAQNAANHMHRNARNRGNLKRPGAGCRIGCSRQVLSGHQGQCRQIRFRLYRCQRAPGCPIRESDPAGIDTERPPKKTFRQHEVTGSQHRGQSPVGT